MQSTYAFLDFVIDIVNRSSEVINYENRNFYTLRSAMSLQIVLSLLSISIFSTFFSAIFRSKSGFVNRMQFAHVLQQISVIKLYGKRTICVVWCGVLSCHVMSCHVLSYLALSCRVLSCPMLSYVVMSCPELLRLVVFCPVLCSCVLYCVLSYGIINSSF